MLIFTLDGFYLAFRFTLEVTIFILEMPLFALGVLGFILEMIIDALEMLLLTLGDDPLLDE